MKEEEKTVARRNGFNSTATIACIVCPRKRGLIYNRIMTPAILPGMGASMLMLIVRKNSYLHPLRLTHPIHPIHP